MTNSQLLDTIANLQSVALRSARDKYHARTMFWLVAEMGWELMCARDINALEWEEFKERQEALFEMTWTMISGGDTEKVKNPWVRQLYSDVMDEVDVLNADVLE